MPKQLEHICKNCALYNGPTSTCSVRVIHEGVVYRDLPVGPKDACVWEQWGMLDDIKQVRFRVWDEHGNPTSGNGRVTIEYEEGFFGQRT